MKRNILLIGGSHGIGKAIVERLHQTCNVYIASRTNTALSNYEMTHIHFDATTDILDEDALPKEIHGFVYCPGSINLKPFKMLALEAIRDDMEINFFSLVKTTKTVLPKMVEGSSMVFFSTVAVGTGMPFHTSIASAKGAIEGFIKSMAAEYAPKIRVNGIAPSLVDTPLARRLLGNDKKRELMAQRHPLKRVGTANDIANLAAFLLNDESTWVTGQIFGVDGGMSTLNIS
ncbi:MAG: SDR family oxidoreductase [Bacteroidota bacterium]